MVVLRCSSHVTRHGLLSFDLGRWTLDLGLLLSYASPITALSFQVLPLRISRFAIRNRLRTSIPLRPCSSSPPQSTVSALFFVSLALNNRFPGSLR